MTQMIIGACLRNEAAVTRGDFELFRIARFTGVVPLWHQDPKTVTAWGVEPRNCPVRLPDSEITDWENGQIVGKHIAGWRDYVDLCMETVARFYALGFRYFVLDNEPNLVWPSHIKPWDGKPYSAGDYAAFLEDVAPTLKARLPHDAMLGLPPMSHPSLHPEWIAEIVKKRIAQDETKPLLGYFDFAASHCYWQAEGDMEAGWAGEEFIWLHNHTGLDVLITEAGNSSIQQAHPPPLSEIESRQARQYPQYTRQVAGFTFVKGIYFFTLGHNGDFVGFDLTERVCQALSPSHGSGGGGPVGSRPKRG